ncbi:MAG: hypothetical protein LBG22_05525 [Treponema sp.]|jgi:hypothetical protein|nr:hypothetical protein [Treponema sp.]
MRRRILTGFAVFFIPLFAGAQSDRPGIRFDTLMAEGISSNEKKLIESLILSYLQDFGELVSSPADLNDENKSKTPFIDFVISGSIYLERESRIFMLQIDKLSTGEKNSFTSVYKSAGEMVLKARSFLANAFSSSGDISLAAASKAKNSDPEKIDTNSLLGTWQGEQGIEMIRFQRSGRGIAIFSSGAQMVLSYSINDNTLHVIQNSPNSLRYYHPLPIEAARKMAEAAPPMEWEFILCENGTVLRGFKFAAKAKMDGEFLEEIILKDVQEVEWKKLPR